MLLPLYLIVMLLLLYFDTVGKLMLLSLYLITAIMAKILSQKEEDIHMLLAADAHLGTKNVNFQMERYFFKKRADEMQKLVLELYVLFPSSNWSRQTSLSQKVKWIREHHMHEDGVRTFNNFLREGLIEYLDVNEQNNALMLMVVEVDQAVVGAAVVVSMMLIEVLMFILKMLMEVDGFAAMILQMLWVVEMDQMAVAAALSMAFRTQKVRHFRSRV
ncbi:hypothetical protein C5167_004618 [Papaver somniferum]|uniref:RNA polymerase Rpb2 domain-containing protein n=1 Tax=Papaver somniferum TaxID=3469 RepID=A0A4Y7JCE2_PAPSO|nr:hypothetical protein C5167_004618 [Papaver somniferum]